MLPQEFHPPREAALALRLPRFDTHSLRSSKEASRGLGALRLRRGREILDL
jgi:hypothetical protein